MAAQDFAISDPERTQGLAASATKGDHVLVELKEPGSRG